MQKKNIKQALPYVDGYVLTVPKDNLKAYKKLAAEAGKLWKKHGALDYKECVGEDLNPNMGGAKIMSFSKLAKPKDDEVVIFSFITFMSKKHRNEVNKNVMKDPAMNAEKFKDKPMPFDMKRMAYGGFQAIVSEQ